MAGLILNGDTYNALTAYNRLFKKSDCPIHNSYDPSRAASAGVYSGNLLVKGGGASCTDYYIRNYYTWPRTGLPRFILGDSFGNLRGPSWNTMYDEYYGIYCTATPPADSLYDIPTNRLLYNEEAFKVNTGSNVNCSCGFRMHIGRDGSQQRGWASTTYYYNYAYLMNPPTLHIFIGYHFTGPNGLIDINSGDAYLLYGERYCVDLVDEYYQLTISPNAYFDIQWTYPFTYKAPMDTPVTVFIFFEQDLGYTYNRCLYKNMIYARKNTANTLTASDYTPSSPENAGHADPRLFWYRKIIYDQYMIGSDYFSYEMNGWGMAFDLYKDESTSEPGFLDISIRVDPTHYIGEDPV